jgi:hypothetical protein
MRLAIPAAFRMARQPERCNQRPGVGISGAQTTQNRPNPLRLLYPESSSG